MLGDRALCVRLRGGGGATLPLPGGGRRRCRPPLPRLEHADPLRARRHPDRRAARASVGAVALAPSCSRQDRDAPCPRRAVRLHGASRRHHGAADGGARGRRARRLILSGRAGRPHGDASVGCHGQGRRRLDGDSVGGRPRSRGSREAIEGRARGGRGDRWHERRDLHGLVTPAPGLQPAGIRRFRLAGPRGLGGVPLVQVQDLSRGRAQGVGVRREEGRARGGRPRRQPSRGRPATQLTARARAREPASRRLRPRDVPGSTAPAAGGGGRGGPEDVHRPDAGSRRRARRFGRALRPTRDADRRGLRRSRARPARAGHRRQPVHHRLEHEAADHPPARPARRRGPLRLGHAGDADLPALQDRGRRRHQAHPSEAPRLRVHGAAPPGLGVALHLRPVVAAGAARGAGDHETHDGLRRALPVQQSARLGRRLHRRARDQA